MTTQKSIDINGQIIWTETLGNFADAPILLISGAGAHAHFWSDSFCQHLLDAGFFLIRYDHRDTGLSGASDQDYGLEELVEDAVGILNAYNLSAAHIIGHSMGGYIGQFMALSHPDRMLSFVAISTGPAGETEDITVPQSQEEKEMMQKTWLIMLRNRPDADFERSYEGFATVWERLNGGYPVDREIAHRYTEEMYTRSHYPVGAHDKHMQVMQKMAQSLKERKEIFRQITLPTLILHGQQDCLIPPKRGGEALSNVLPHAQYESLSEMGHMFFNREMEKKIADKITAFLRM